MCHTRSEPSWAPETSQLAMESAARQVTESVWPRSTAVHVPPCMSDHTRTVRSVLPVNSVFAAQVTHVTRSRCPLNVAAHFIAATSQIFASSPSEIVASRSRSPRAV